MFRVVVGVVLVSGCGFRQSPAGDDLGIADLAGADLAGEDLAGADLAGVDLAGADLAGVDLSGADLVGTDLALPDGGTGPGPLGALPSGFCCAADPDCRSRRCSASGAGPKYCVDRCSSSAVCDTWGGRFRCSITTGECEPIDLAYTCLDPVTYPTGAKKTGACCTAGNPRAGQECAGGLCNATGPLSNPFFCTQGCLMQNQCPSGYACNADRWCWKLDPSAPYTCDP